MDEDKAVHRGVKNSMWGSSPLTPPLKFVQVMRSDDGYWRIKTNQEINDILKGQNIIGFIKKQRLN